MEPSTPKDLQGGDGLGNPERAVEPVADNSRTSCEGVVSGDPTEIARLTRVDFLMPFSKTVAGPSALKTFHGGDVARTLLCCTRVILEAVAYAPP